ncbi:hypothetical protein [Quadrisphaera sp. INWT6]|uniref:hypothetical protein n=1 Tax=Quadrisphaera sp. INWT6 TaxID=2596917 RepID=UPI00189207F7|nr:hypothetical protein [Quadrisphaera sp. INWT6]MBF5082900.1 hypothetical protein [Quadrisphaera sp. INWT6]
MASRKTLALVTAGVLGLGGVAAAGAAVAAGDDPRTAVGSVDAGALQPAPAAPAASGGTSSAAPQGVQQVASLQVLQGVLVRDEDDDADDRDDADDADDRYDDLSVNGVDVDLGPSEWVLTAPALQDYDGDGTAEPFAAELDGLVGQQVTLQVRYDDDSDDDDDDRADDRLDDADVYELQGLALRAASGPAPWAGGAVPTGPLAG